MFMAFSAVGLGSVCGMIGHCTPLHDGPGISWWHVALWCGLVSGAALLVALGLRFLTDPVQPSREGGSDADDDS